MLQNLQVQNLAVYSGTLLSVNAIFSVWKIYVVLSYLLTALEISSVIIPALLPFPWFFAAF